MDITNAKIVPVNISVNLSPLSLDSAYRQLAGWIIHRQLGKTAGQINDGLRQAKDHRAMSPAGTYGVCRRTQHETAQMEKWKSWQRGTLGHPGCGGVLLSICKIDANIVSFGQMFDRTDCLGWLGVLRQFQPVVFITHTHIRGRGGDCSLLYWVLCFGAGKITDTNKNWTYQTTEQPCWSLQFPFCVVQN